MPDGSNGRPPENRCVQPGGTGTSAAGKECENVGVDSGQAGIFNEKYYEENQPKEEWYDRICELTNDEHFGVIDNEGVVSRTGYGDGSYRAYAAFYDGKIVGIKIYYI